MLYNIMILKPFTFFYIIHDYITIAMTCNKYMIVCNIMLNPNSKSKNMKINGKKIRKKRKSTIFNSDR